MMGQLSEFGYILEEKVENAELVLINSCTVKNPSQDAFINWVKSSRERGQKIVVAGCVP
jgi:threonylcarbamoyladenosine tRNA methylthiotransferase CDKAL1